MRMCYTGGSKRAALGRPVVSRPHYASECLVARPLTLSSLFSRFTPRAVPPRRPATPPRAPWSAHTHLPRQHSTQEPSSCSCDTCLDVGALCAHDAHAAQRVAREALLLRRHVGQHLSRCATSATAVMTECTCHVSRTRLLLRRDVVLDAVVHLTRRSGRASAGVQQMHRAS